MRRALLSVVLAALLLAPGASAWTRPAGPVFQPFPFDPSHPYAGGAAPKVSISAVLEGSPVLSAPRGGNG